MATTIFGRGRKEEASSVEEQPQPSQEEIAAFNEAVIGSACPIGQCIGTVEYSTSRSIAMVTCSYNKNHFRPARIEEIAAQAIARGVLKEL